MKLIGYIRVSTARQANEGWSLEAQRERLYAYAAAKGCEISRIEVDAGLSAKSMDRPALERCLSSLEAGLADGVIVCKLDRLTRSVRDLDILLERYFNKYELISLQDNIDTTSASGRLVLNILTTVAQWERETTAERTREAFAHIRASGLPAGPTPLGWSRQNGDMVKDPRGQETIAIIRRMHNNGYSLREIGAELHRLGHRTVRGGDWHASTINKVINRIENQVA